MKYRLVVGEKGNEQGHIIDTDATSMFHAKIYLRMEVSKYKGDGWGHIEEDMYEDDRWRRV